MFLNIQQSPGSCSAVFLQYFYSIPTLRSHLGPAQQYFYSHLLLLLLLIPPTPSCARTDLHNTCAARTSYLHNTCAHVQVFLTIRAQARRNFLYNMWCTSSNFRLIFTMSNCTNCPRNAALQFRIICSACEYCTSAMCTARIMCNVIVEAATMSRTQSSNV